MAQKHQLSLEVPDTNNVKVFRVTDTSIYTDSIDIKCPVLHITVPGFTEPVEIEVLPYFNLVLNACTLNIVPSGCGENSPALPDGIYHIRYSVSPNDKVYVEYYHLRITQTLNVYNNALNGLELNCCEPSADIKSKLDELRLIRDFIYAAKIKIEEFHDLEKGMSMLIYAKKRLTKYVTGCKNC